MTMLKLTREHAQLRAALVDLVEWEAGMGGFDAKPWRSAKSLLRVIPAAPELAQEYAIKVRVGDAGTWKFLSGSDGMTRLRVHAQRFPTRARAQACANKSAPLNPGTEWKVVKI